MLLYTIYYFRLTKIRLFQIDSPDSAGVQSADGLSCRVLLQTRREGHQRQTFWVSNCNKIPVRYIYINDNKYHSITKKFWITLASRQGSIYSLIHTAFVGFVCSVLCSLEFLHWFTMIILEIFSFAPAGKNFSGSTWKTFGRRKLTELNLKNGWLT